MRISQWKPYAGCSSTENVPPQLSACTFALNQMPTSSHQEIFGLPGGRDVDIPLPVKFSDGQHNPYSSCHAFLHLLTCASADSACTIEVAITGAPIKANWYGMWTSAVSIVAMCVRFDREGVSIGRCECPPPLCKSL